MDKKRTGPVRRWKRPTFLHIQVERGEVELLRLMAQQDKRGISDMVRAHLRGLFTEARERFPRRAADLQARGEM